MCGTDWQKQAVKAKGQLSPKALTRYFAVLTYSTQSFSSQEKKAEV
jgi:hypothetical protein